MEDSLFSKTYDEGLDINLIQKLAQIQMLFNLYQLL